MMAGKNPCTPTDHMKILTPYCPKCGIEIRSGPAGTLLMHVETRLKEYQRYSHDIEKAEIWSGWAAWIREAIDSIGDGSNRATKRGNPK